jgi:hypothetical protein
MNGVPGVMQLESNGLSGTGSPLRRISAMVCVQLKDQNTKPHHNNKEQTVLSKWTPTRQLALAGNACTRCAGTNGLCGSSQHAAQMIGHPELQVF